MGRRGFRFLGNFNSLNQTSPARQLKRGPCLHRVRRRRLNHSKRLRSLELQDVESGVVVGEVHHALGIDEAVGRLDDFRSVGTRIEHALGIGRHEEPGLARLERILDVKDRDARIVVGRKDEAEL
jgi:hypothetical protein